MIQVPGAVLARFESCLAAKNILENLRIHYKKWLRFYLDFCSKYHRDDSKTKSLVRLSVKVTDASRLRLQNDIETLRLPGRT